MDEHVLDKLRRLTEEEQAILEGRHEINRNLYMRGASNTIDRNKLLAKGQLITVRSHTRFVEFPAHTHNYVEVVYMCEGSTRHQVNGQEIVLEQGDLLFMAQDAIQEISAAGEGDVAVNFIILPEFFDRTLMMLDEEKNMVRDFLIGCLRNELSDIAYLHFKVADILPVQNLVENLIWTLVNLQPNKRFVNQTTMGLLFLQLQGNVDRLTTGTDNLDQEILVRVYQFIEEQYKDGELSDLAAEMGYDLYWLSRRVKQLTGRTYKDLLQEKRLNQSVYLLHNSNLSVADIGYAVGYSNLSYFYRLFRKHYGMTPKSFREDQG